MSHIWRAAIPAGIRKVLVHSDICPWVARPPRLHWAGLCDPSHTHTQDLGGRRIWMEETNRLDSCCLVEQWPTWDGFRTESSGPFDPAICLQETGVV